MNEKFFVTGAKKILPTVNSSPYKRILAVGDIHGKFKELISLWEKLNVTDDDLVIFLGDYIDRGESVAEVLEWVMAHKDKKNFVFLRGNHEQMMIDAINSEGADSFTWIINGGKKTILALRELNAKKIVPFDDIRNFIENLPLSYSIELGGRKYFFCHAGVDGEAPLDKQDEHFLLWAREEFFNGYNGDDVIISGHSPIKFFFDFDAINPRPIKIPGKNILMVDTGAFIPGGRLSAVDILSGQYWQSGQDKQGDIIFVCAGNTCRSAMAKYIMRHLIAEAKLTVKILVDSAGCKTYGGSFMSVDACKALINNNIDFSRHVSKTFTIREYQNFKCVIALDRAVMEKAIAISQGDPDKKIRMFKDADGNEINVADPFGTDNYGKAYAEILRGCRELLKEISK